MSSLHPLASEWITPLAFLVLQLPNSKQMLADDCMNQCCSPVLSPARFLSLSPPLTRWCILPYYHKKESPHRCGFPCPRLSASRITSQINFFVHNWPVCTVLLNHQETKTPFLLQDLSGSSYSNFILFAYMSYYCHSVGPNNCRADRDGKPCCLMAFPETPASAMCLCQDYSP